MVPVHRGLPFLLFWQYFWALKGRVQLGYRYNIVPSRPPLLGLKHNKFSTLYLGDPARDTSPVNGDYYDPDSIWVSRRDIARVALTPIASKVIKKKKELTSLPHSPTNPIDGKRNEDLGKSSVVLSVAVVAIGALVIRLGGRAAFIQVLGLDFVTENGLVEQMNSFVTFFQQTLPAPAQLGGLFLAWLVAKV
eukprot:gene36488-49144_t